MDAITLLRDDHKTVEQLFKRFEQAGERAYADKRKIVDRIIEELSVHAAIEEQAFYPVVRSAVDDAEDIALESLEEHHIVKWLLSELEGLDPTHERFDAKVTVLIENVRHHVKEEETELFPKVRSTFSRTVLAELGEALADAKRNAPTHPHPRLPDAGPINAATGAIAGVVDRLNDNVSGLAQGGVNAVQDLIARITGGDRPKVSPTGSSKARTRAHQVRRAASTATEGAGETVRSAKSGAAKTARATAEGAKGTVTTAKRSASATATSARRATTSATGTAKAAAKATRTTAKRAASKTTVAATSSR